MGKGKVIEGVFDNPVKDEDMEKKGGVVVGGVCGGVCRGKWHIWGGLIEGDDRDDILNINIAQPFVKLIGVFAFLLNSICVLNWTISSWSCKTIHH